MKENQETKIKIQEIIQENQEIKEKNKEMNKKIDQLMQKVEDLERYNIHSNERVKND